MEDMTRKILESPFSHLENQDLEIGKMAQWLRDPPERWSPRLGFQEMLWMLSFLPLLCLLRQVSVWPWIRVPPASASQAWRTPVLPHLAGFQYFCFTLHSLEKSSKVKVTFLGRVKMDGKGRVNLWNFVNFLNILISVVFQRNISRKDRRSKEKDRATTTTH